MDPHILVVSIILAVTIGLIIFEVIRIDVVALVAMLALVWVGVISPEEARSGFASNAVIAVIAVMIMGRGMHRTGVTHRIGEFITHIAGETRRSVITTLGLTVGSISSFMQNIGAAALFLPVTTGISKRENIPVSSLLMPMGFAALLGGTLTMVGTSSLIVLNDLLDYAGLEPFGLFAVTPVGVALLLSGVAYFFVFGPAVLPSHSPPRSTPRDGTLDRDTPPSGRDIEQLVDEYDHKSAAFETGKFPTENAERGYLEVVIPVRSNLVGRTLQDTGLREKHDVQVVLYSSDSEVVEEELAARTIRAGDTMVLHGQWQHLKFFADSQDFVTMTPLPSETESGGSALVAVAAFALAVGLVAVAGAPISVGFLTGAVLMILGRVMTVEQAYRAIELKVVFLLAGLIPIGIAMENSGMAALIADHVVATAGELHPFLILLAIGAIMTAFSLTMSNIAATVLMVPLVLELGTIGGLDPRIMVLQVGICAANSFIIPTHHVNALLMTPGGYRTRDYAKAGVGLSVVFLLVSTTVLYFGM